MEFDEIFDELNDAVFDKKEIRIFKVEFGDKTRWFIEIGDPQKAGEFESRLSRFINALKKIRGEKDAENAQRK